MANVLVVDDDAVVREVLSEYLQRDGHRVTEAADGDTALALLRQSPPDLVVLDVMLPGTSGLDVCRWIRAQGDLPVILLSALDEETDRIVGLELGADDYVRKPFSPREVLARVRTVLRRSAAVPDRAHPISGAGLVIDARTREVRRGDREIPLTALEFDLLWFLASHPRVVFSREQLLSAVWGHTEHPDLGTNTVTVQIRRLREKVEQDPARPVVIQTVWGVGYRFVP